MVSSRFDYDVAVVGAGPAGSGTARSLAARGYRVALLERDPDIGQPVHCTGIVSDECFERYYLPASLVIRSVSSFVLRAPSGRPARVQRRSMQAHVLDRVGLDRWLADEAARAGADLVTSIAVEDIRWTGNGVRLSLSAGGAPLTARTAVVATGFGAPLARKLGIGSSGELLSGCQVVVEQEGLDEIEVFTGDALGRGGFGWLVPWRDGLGLAGLLTRKHTMHRLREHLARLRAAGRIGRVVQEFRLRAVPIGLPDRAVADGIVAVGDVAGQVKPTSGGGIYYALLSAELAASTLTEALEVGDVTAAGLAPYEEQWRAALGSEIRQGMRLRRLIEQLPESAIEQLHRLLGVPVLRRVLVSAAPSLDWHSSKLTHVLERLDRHLDAEPAPVR